MLLRVCRARREDPLATELGVDNISDDASLAARASAMPFLDLLSNAARLADDREGCRLLLWTLAHRSPEDAERLWAAIAPHTLRLIEHI